MLSSSTESNPTHCYPGKQVKTWTEAISNSKADQMSGNSLPEGSDIAWGAMMGQWSPQTVE